jgi:Na+/proline symporter
MPLVAWIVFLAVTGYTIWDGVRRSRGAKDLEGFFAAGRSIPWWAAGLSVMATQLSAITILSGVGLGYENGPEWVQVYFALPFAMIVLCIWFVPAIRQHPILTAYEFLERRFGPVTRALTSLAFLLSRCLAFAVVLYAPAVVFSVMTGMPIGPTVWVTGLATTAYTVIGGTGGVVWTDVKQMLLIFAGVFVCFVWLAWDTTTQLGVGDAVLALGTANKLDALQVWDPQWTFDPTAGGNSFWADRYNLWTGLFGTLCLFLSYFGCDQSQVQSVLTSKSADASRSALLMSAFTKVPLQMLVLLLGSLLWLHHSLAKEPLLFQPQEQSLAKELEGPHREQLATATASHQQASERRTRALQALAADTAGADAELRESTAAAAAARKAARAAIHASEVAAGRRAQDQQPNESNYIFPHFLFHEVPAPLLGLMLAAIFAAAISSAAGALSSLTSATMVDFYRRWLRPDGDDRQTLRRSRIVMAIWGTAATAAATSLGDGPLLERVNEIGSWFYGSILGVFLLALFVPRATELAASTGLVAGLLTVVAGKYLLKVAYLWDNVIGAVGCVGTGLLVAMLAPGPRLTSAAPVEPVSRAWALTYWKVAALAVLVMIVLGAMSAIGDA